MGPRVDVVLPDLGLPNVRVSVWYANPGDHVYQGDRLVEVIVEGATFDVPAPVTGELVSQVVFAQDEVKPGQVLGAVVPHPE